jgi:hypothetical protein
MTGVQGNPQEAPATPGEERLRSSPPLDARGALPRGRAAWTVALTVLSAGALLAANAHGRGARVPFVPPAELDGGRVLSVKDAGEAVLVWRSAELRGRHLVVLTGRWSRPQRPGAHPRSLGELQGRPAGPALELDALSALYVAAGTGIARRMDVVMPPAALALRRSEVSARKELRAGPGGDAFRLPANGFDRRFSTPDAFEPPSEPVLVLVEPSWFAAGAPDPFAWLASKGVRADLVVLALEDPAARAEERARSAAYAGAAHAVRAELRE